MFCTDGVLGIWGKQSEFCIAMHEERILWIAAKYQINNLRERLKLKKVKGL